MPATRTIDIEELSQYFSMPEKAVAKQLGICLTSLKKICRQNGIHRWPYRKVKSMDKKLRKLEGTPGGSEGSTAGNVDDALLDGLDDGVLHAMTSEVDSPVSADFESASEEGEASASSATTPRVMEFTASAVSSPHEEGAPEKEASQRSSPQMVAVTPSKRSAFESVPVKFSKATAGQPIKLELSLPPDMLQQMANGAQNITFTIQGVDGNGTHVQLSSESLQAATISEEPREAPVPAEAKTETAEGDMGMSDEDIIAMLAGCAAPCRPRQESFAEVVRDRSAAGCEMSGGAGPDASVLEPSDAELMAALAGCCGMQNPFNPGYEEEHTGAEQVYQAEEVMEWNGDGMEDILGEA